MYTYMCKKYFNTNSIFDFIFAPRTATNELNAWEEIICSHNGIARVYHCKNHIIENYILHIIAFVILFIYFILVLSQPEI